MEDILPLEEAVDAIDAKTPIGSLMRSAEWARVPLALRHRAQFSAGVASARVLQTIQDRLSAQISQQREKLLDGKQATFDRSSFIDAVRDLARDEGLTPVKEELRGGVQDITSIPRLGLIYDMQNAMAAGYARHKLDTSEGALVIFPAYRLGPSSAKEPRPAIWWQQQWSEAGSRVGWEGASQTSFVALKSSPIWAALSTFGTPWPPFDWGSTRQLEEVDREEAINLGLITPDQTPTPGVEGGEDFNAQLEASVRGLGDELKRFLKESFADDVVIEADTVRWSAHEATKTLPVSSPPATPPSNPDADVLATNLQQQKFSPAVVEAAKKLPITVTQHLKGVTFTPTNGGAFYRRADKGVRLSKDPQSWGGGEQTFHHEVGHHLHYETGMITEVATRADFKTALAADLDVWKKSVESTHGVAWKNVYKRNSRAMLDEIASQLGIVKFDPQNDMLGAKRIGRVADTIMGLTDGKYGAGHALAYMKVNGHKEVFAHAYSALMQRDADFQKQFPNVTLCVKKELKL